MKVTTSLCLSALLAGFALTVWGLWHLAWPQALPWSDSSSLFRYVVFIVTSAVLILAGSFWSKSSPLVLGTLVATALALLSGSLWPLLVVAWFAFASTLLGKVVLVALKMKSAQEDWLIHFLVGAGIYGTAVGLLAHLPVNYPGIYGVALMLPLLLWWRDSIDHAQSFWAWFIRKNTREIKVEWLDVAIVVIGLVHFIVALMPELGHDALAMHLFIPSHLASRHHWGFDADTYVWAVMPMLGDWIFAVGYMLAGETAARIINIAFILALGWLIRDMVLWAGGTITGARWAVLIFLSTPLTFTESSKLFIESIWAVFIVSGAFSLLQLSESSDRTKSWGMLAALFLAFAAATKAVTLTILPVMLLLVLWHYKSWSKQIGLFFWFRAVGLFLIIGLIPYFTAWWATGNPVFPFFNGIFKSPHYPSVNFDSASIFGKGMDWDILYRATFDSGKYLEAGAGASGFQWLLLFVPTSIALFAEKQHKGAILLLVGVLIVALVFQSVSYFRYAFPAWAIIAAAIGCAMSCVSTDNKVKVAWIIVSIGAVLLNMLFLSAGAMHRDFPLKSIWDSGHRSSYLNEKLPIRNAVELVNQLNIGRSPVAVFAQPLTAGLESDALYSNWYNFRFQGEMNDATTADAVVNVLLRSGVDFVIMDSNWSGSAVQRELIGKVTELIVEYGSIGVHRVRAGYRFKTELLRNPEFSSNDGWSFVPGAEYDAASRVITTTVSAPVAQAIPVSPGQRYRNTVVTRCFKEATLGRVQINWLDVKGQFLSTDIKTFDCTPEWTEQTMDIAAPPSAKVAIVYATSHTATPLQFKSNSLKQ